MLRPWTTADRRTVFQPAGGKWMTVEQHTVELPSGEVIDDWLWVVTPDFVNVVVETTGGEYVCFRQTKYAVEGTTMAIVGGYIDPGEDPLTAAEREVAEETGYRAEEWTSLGAYAVDGNRGNGTAHLFLARGAVPAGDGVAAEVAESDDLEDQELLLLTRDEVREALLAGEFKVAPWAAAVAMALATD